MNHPKFKFGDKVVIKKTGKSFEVFAIAKSDESFSYRDEFYKSFFEREDDLELYREPQKKKLYAYKKEFGQVQFSTFEGPWIGHFSEAFYRAPEYDIEYPSKEEA